MNLAKYKKVQSAYDDVAERADMAENTLKSSFWGRMCRLVELRHRGWKPCDRRRVDSSFIRLKI